jgi:2-keto-4-pentenoate hydratase/2-oxohepta-3-ene-1,7-dioic acid hydratase in catechol pathway
MKILFVLILLLAQAGPAALAAQRPLPVEPFKVGTFEIGGVPRVALVLRDALAVELAEANRSVESGAGRAGLQPPADMIELIEGYEEGWKDRLYDIVDHLVRTNQLEPGRRPAYVHEVTAIRTLPPILYPGKILNAAVNFYSHVNESGTEAERAEARRLRREQRGVPYLFLKPGRGAVVGNGDPIVLPWGRDRIDWEVELGVVIGRTAKNLDATAAPDYVFGYTVHIDVSDRGGRPPGGHTGGGTDWFVGKGHDTFAPLGPWIVPKEFYGDPMERLHQILRVGGVQLQEARAGDMIHTLWELIEYATSIITLYPGDVINNGTSGGTAAGAAQVGTRDQFLQPGDVIEASIEGIGTLRMPVVAGEEPRGGTGARLPPVRTYRP